MREINSIIISNDQKEKIVRTGGSGGVDSQTKKAPAVTIMHSNTRTHAVMWTGFGDKIKNACGQAVSGIRKRKAKHPRQICRFFCNNKMKECASDWLDPVTKQKSTCGHEDVCSTHTISHRMRRWARGAYQQQQTYLLNL